jgi:hypothetical protein
MQEENLSNATIHGYLNASIDRNLFINPEEGRKINPFRRNTPDRQNWFYGYDLFQKKHPSKGNSQASGPNNR